MYKVKDVTFIYILCLKFDSGVSTLTRSREENLRLQPDRSISVHHRCGSGVRQADQVLSLLLLRHVHEKMPVEQTVDFSRVGQPLLMLFS